MPKLPEPWHGLYQELDRISDRMLALRSFPFRVCETHPTLPQQALLLNDLIGMAEGIQHELGGVKGIAAYQRQAIRDMIEREGKQ
jgi:hypothetical protein